MHSAMKYQLSRSMIQIIQLWVKDTQLTKSFSSAVGKVIPRPTSKIVELRDERGSLYISYLSSGTQYRRRYSVRTEPKGPVRAVVTLRKQDDCHQVNIEVKSVDLWYQGLDEMLRLWVSRLTTSRARSARVSWMEVYVDYPVHVSTLLPHLTYTLSSTLLTDKLPDGVGWLGTKGGIAAHIYNKLAEIRNRLAIGAFVHPADLALLTRVSELTRVEQRFYPRGVRPPVTDLVGMVSAESTQPLSGFKMFTCVDSSLPDVLARRHPQGKRASASTPATMPEIFAAMMSRGEKPEEHLIEHADFQTRIAHSVREGITPFLVSSE